jgi:hypothetical protein
MSGAIHPLPQYVFRAWCLVKHRDNFTFYIPLQCQADSDSSSIFIVKKIKFKLFLVVRHVFK